MTAERSVRPVGDGGWLVDLPDLGAALALSRALRDQPAPEQLEVVAGARTVLVRHGGGLTVGALRRHLADLQPATADAAARTVVIDVVYSGTDLEDVAGLTGLTHDEVIAAHTGTPWTVGFTGFAPGFGYLVGGDPRLRVPRRDHPRPAVPAGSVALAGEFSAVYPRESPGGWQLIGRTDAPLWDLRRDPPALLTPGTSVEFRAVDRLEVPAPTTVPELPASERSVELGVRIDDPGPRCLVQDLGRPGLAHLGVSGSGAADRGAVVKANRLVGNRDDAGTLEVTLGGLRLTALEPCVVGLAGARLAVNMRSADGAARSVDPFAEAVDVPAGTQLRLGRPAGGLRTYVAVRGGLDVAPVLGSRSTDILSGIGPEPVARGDVLPIGEVAAAEPTVRPAAGASGRSGGGEPGDATDLQIVLGPRDDWFTAEAITTLLDATWQVGRETDRVGVHLDGPSLSRSRTDELPSEGMVPGAVQVPASGRPVVFGVDHPVTGGYPVIAVLTSAAADLAAQLRPGRAVRFRVRDRLGRGS